MPRRFWEASLRHRQDELERSILSWLIAFPIVLISWIPIVLYLIEVF